MGKEIVTQVQETQRVPNRINPRQNIPRHILIKLMKIKHKEQILKAAREKQKNHEKILEEIIFENFLNMGKEIATQVQETQRVLNRINPK